MADQQEAQMPTSDLLEKLVAEHSDKENIPLRDIKNSLHERGFGVITVIATLPVSMPFPMPPGYSTIFAIPLVLLSLQMLMGKDSPWLPAWLMRKQISQGMLTMLVRKGNKVLRKIEKFLHPRLVSANAGKWEKIVGGFAFIFALSIALPIPGTHTLPAWGILLMALGLISADGIVIVGGIIIGSAGMVLTVIVLYLTFSVGEAAVQQMLEHLGAS